MHSPQTQTSPDQSLAAPIEARVNLPSKNRTTHTMSIALNFPGSKSPEAVAWLIGREMLADASEAARKLGGGWRNGVSMFAALPEMKFALLIAPTPRRITSRAPYVMMARDVPTLAAVTAHACGLLSDITCQWMYMSRDERACEAVRRVSLADAQVFGGAQ